MVKAAANFSTGLLGRKLRARGSPRSCAVGAWAACAKRFGVAAAAAAARCNDAAADVTACTAPTDAGGSFCAGGAFGAVRRPNFFRCSSVSTALILESFACMSSFSWLCSRRSSLRLSASCSLDAHSACDAFCSRTLSSRTCCNSPRSTCSSSAVRLMASPASRSFVWRAWFCSLRFEFSWKYSSCSDRAVCNLSTASSRSRERSAVRRSDSKSFWSNSSALAFNVPTSVCAESYSSE
mmetsp:Transcript_74549/g.216234  ORF Transcript_74549/g.216234 Transcript_74549/m.216234 type:complete len:238 (+) Transcript_74549:112-825(+)